LSGHINIVQFIAAASIGKEESGHGQAEFLILTELCTGLLNICQFEQALMNLLYYLVYQAYSELLFFSTLLIPLFPVKQNYLGILAI